MSGKIHITFDIRLMGISAHIPAIVCIGLIYYGWTYAHSIESVIRVFEYIYPVTAAWWSVMLFQHVLEEEGSETLFSYPIPRWKLGIARVIVFFSMYIFLLVIMLAILEYRTVENVFYSLGFQLGIQAFFMAGLGFLSVVLTANVGWALLIPISYTSMQIITRGDLFPQINIFFFNRNVQDVSTVLQDSMLTFIVGLVWFVTAQYLLKHFERYR